jgi:hypothetical protein
MDHWSCGRRACASFAQEFLQDRDFLISAIHVFASRGEIAAIKRLLRLPEIILHAAHGCHDVSAKPESLRLLLGSKLLDTRRCRVGTCLEVRVAVAGGANFLLRRARGRSRNAGGG